jgi:hypothetical protein
VNSIDLRCPAALLSWLSVLALAAASSSCRVTPGYHWTSVEAPPPAPRAPQRTREASAAATEYCAQVCRAEPDPQCHPATRDGVEVVVCEYRHAAIFDGPSIVPTPFGRVSHWAPLATDHPATSEAQHYLDCARSEAASIVEFRQLALDLDRLRAPRESRRAALRAAADEARHARWALRQARRFGLRDAQFPRLPRVQPRTPDLTALALENATAGCAAETFGVWLHLVQARSAPDPELRAGAQAIAADEARHSALAFQLFDWFAKRLSPAEHDRVRSALLQQWSRMPDSLRLDDTLAARLGIPSRAERVHHAQTMTAVLMDATSLTPLLALRNPAPSVT